jgi:hypothetical protein
LVLPRDCTVNHLLAAVRHLDSAPWASELEPISLPLEKVLYESGGKLTHEYFPTTSIVSLLYVL